MNYTVQKPTYIMLFVLLIFTAPVSKAQVMNCAELKNGMFYYYPKNSSDSYIDIRDDNYLHESNLKKGDSTLYEIKWMDNCTYSLKYISGNEKFSEDVLDFFKKHKLIYQITGITKDYYTFKGYVDKTTNQPVSNDTMWLNLKQDAANNELFKQIKNPSEIKRAHFSDTSKYAILYVYRPGKLVNSLGNYLIYFDDNVMCVAKNNSGYIFKILKEGKFTIKSRIYKEEASLSIDVKFGNSYYIKSTIPGGFHNFNNYKLKIEAVNPEDGKTEFANVDLQ